MSASQGREFCYIDSLLKLKEKGLVRHVGVSVMTPDACAKIIASGLVEAVQIPTNVFDRRFTRSGAECNLLRMEQR